MKKTFILSLLFAAMAVLSFAQNETPAATASPNAAPTGGPIMTLESNTVDYGTMEQHGEPLRVLKFTNTGTEPLVIKNARGSCGCTVPTWPKEPVMPGEESTIEIRYATNRLGAINKNVTITTNEGGDPHVIKVIGMINKAEDEESVPTKAGGILKGGN